MHSKNSKPEKELPDWDRAALAYAKARAQDDGTIGFVVKKGAAADAWVHYFGSLGMKAKAKFMKFHVETGGSYTVPTEWPNQYDPTYSPDRSHARNREIWKTNHIGDKKTETNRWWDR